MLDALFDAPAPQAARPEKETAADNGIEPLAEQITIDDFAKVALKTAKVLQAEKVEGADKLLKLQIEVGGEKRQIVSGIAAWYTPVSLTG